MSQGVNHPDAEATPPARDLDESAVAELDRELESPGLASAAAQRRISDRSPMAPGLGEERASTGLAAASTVTSALAEAMRGINSTATLAAAHNAAYLTASLRDFASIQTPMSSLAASMRASNSAITATSAIAEAMRGINPALTATSAVAEAYRHMSKLAAPPSLISARMHLLEEGFRGVSGTEADVFGRLQTAIDRRPDLAKATVRAIRATQTSGPFGPDVAAIQDSASALAEVLESGTASDSIAGPLSEMQEVTNLNDEVLWNFGDELGLWDRVKTHRVSSVGIICGFTSGLLSFTVNVGMGQPAPVGIFASLTIGGSVYFWIASKHQHR